LVFRRSLHTVLKTSAQWVEGAVSVSHYQPVSLKFGIGGL